MEEQIAQEPVAEPQEPQTDVEETEVQHETDEQYVESSPIEGDEAPEITPQQIEPEVPEIAPEPLSVPELQAPDIRQFVDADGNLDLVRYQTAQNQFMQTAMQAAVSTATRAAALQNQYSKAWNDAENAYPELKTNKELKDMVQAIHANSSTTGKYLSPVKAAEKLFGLRGEAKAEGMKAAKETRTVQAAATLASPNAPTKAPDGDKATQLKEQMLYGKTAAARKDGAKNYIAELLKAGKL